MRVKESKRTDKGQIQLILKIIDNATSYGIYVEENSQSRNKEKDVDIYSLNDFKFYSIKIEKQGQYFKPMMTTQTTGSARLMLAMAEKLASDKGYFAYYDTDSIFVKTDSVNDIQDS